MYDDFAPIIHDLDGRTIKVWAVADVHLGSKECALEAFRAFLRRVLDDPDSFIVCCGDIINNGTRDSLTNVYEELIPPSEQVQLAVELFKPLADSGKILGMVSGNHEARSRKAVDLDPTYTIACMLGIPHLCRQNMAFVRVKLRRNGSRDTHNLLLMHGKTENKKRHFSYAVEGVDAIVTGHTHNGLAEKPSRMVFTEKGNVRMKPIVSITATSWLSYGGYGLAAMYMPKVTSDPQALELQFTGSNNSEGRIRVIW